MSNEILHSRIQTRFKDIFEEIPDVPKYILDNLNHEIRPYQKQALRQFIYTQRADTADVSFKHLLFHMATGSGKTLVLAGTILYLFKEKGLQNFIFFVNSDAIIKKTRDNLTNTNSPKYLFNDPGIVIDGKSIKIQLVDVFPISPAENTIYLKLTTIQKLHSDLTKPGENKISFDMLKEMRTVLLADEAHHINTLTKSEKKKLSKKELVEKTWESTVQKLLKLDYSNRLVEFTATIDLDNEALFNKYCDKIVYQYDLKSFMDQGYSKNVILLRSNQEDLNKMFNAALLSQYKKYIAQSNGVDFKPIILFKSNKISISKEANRDFLDLIEGLSVDQLKNNIQNGLSIHDNERSIWNKMYKYYEMRNLEKVIEDLQWDFSNESILNANEQSLVSESNAILLNTLEDLNNPIRAIFAVAKLNEGWDVLNLFDIVRISEGATATKKTTDSEAQLIGRGARYHPFIFMGEKSYMRRFDFKETDLKAIETLHYHTINENSYIKKLEQSLEAADIQTVEDHYVKLEAKVKPKIKKTDFYKKGKVYVNKTVPTSVSDYQSLKDYGVSKEYSISYDVGVEKRFGSNKETRSQTAKHEEYFNVSISMLRKAIQRNKFYRFNNLKTYVPAITSIKDFIEGENFLSSVSIIISLPLGLSLNDLSAKEKLGFIEQFLSYVEGKIKSNYLKERGTYSFEGVDISKVITDYVIEKNKASDKIQLNQVIQSKNMKRHDWFVYDNAVVNGLEYEMIDFIANIIQELEEIYSEVYLIRNERKAKIVEFNGTRGFMPDFLLYLKDADFTYQVFLEPKGKKWYTEDKWKEDILMEISDNPDVVVLAENESVRLHGIKFYSEDTDLRREFKEDFSMKVLKRNKLNK
ncbi:DEAD/DEAH box helicase [Halobacillus litoralis]|uniref:DEAD/DEAH box helicase n=1 Tax=Halobacillus litoralis TaxID=45668 RepID=A0A845E1Z7_9BACI|nr:DEAD/DEAH box helicase family protein [Halobacillus litoralis]MYL48289.1 DEAD/DEAH box helicase [Halobacillus litoralis]